MNCKELAKKIKEIQKSKPGGILTDITVEDSPARGTKEENKRPLLPYLIIIDDVSSISENDWNKIKIAADKLELRVKNSGGRIGYYGTPWIEDSIYGDLTISEANQIGKTLFHRWNIIENNAALPGIPTVWECERCEETYKQDRCGMPPIAGCTVPPKDPETHSHKGQNEPYPRKEEK